VTNTVAIIGGGPAGLMAADILSAHGFPVSVFERKPSLGRKFLMAGRGGLNLTHSEPLEKFLQKYGAQAGTLAKIIQDFSPQDLRSWCEGLGEKTFIGTSGRVFPESFKASPLLRAWIGRLEQQGVRFLVQHDWQGWRGDELVFKTSAGSITVKPDAALLALGGASWPRLGSDGSWVEILKAQGVGIAPLEPANCGFTVQWSEIFCKKFAGQPLKPVTASFRNSKVKGEIMITGKGVEGGVIYALSSLLRDGLHQAETVQLDLDLKPDLSLEALEARLRKPRGRDTFSNYLRKSLNLSPVATGLLLESPERTSLGEYPPAKMAQLVKACPVTLRAPFSIERAISTAGGVKFDSLDETFMLLKKPGVFVAGEMLDWEAPTGGYLLQATMATAAHAARGMMSRLG
jgi:hypothetical protein